MQLYRWFYQFPCLFAIFCYCNSATSHSSLDAHSRYKRIVSKASHKKLSGLSPSHLYESVIHPPCKPSTISTFSEEFLHLSPSDMYTAILVPYARVYMAFKYGIALEVISIVASSPSILSIGIRACAVHNITNSIILSKSYHSSFDFHPCSPNSVTKKCKNVCEESLSLYARLVGQQIYVGSSSMSRTKNNSCTWTVHFSPLDDHLNESVLEVYYLWLNELNDPPNQEVVLTTKEKSERINDGNILNLGGIGHVPPYVLNATLTWCDFGGLIIKETRSRDIYLVTRRNKEKRLFSSWGDFSALGFNSSDIYSVTSHFLSLFRTGSEISTTTNDSSSLLDVSSAVTAKSWREQSTCDVPAALKIVKDRSYSLTVDSLSRNMALIYGTPMAIAPVTVNTSARVVSHNSPVRNTDLPWCVDGASTEGRWQRDSRCSGFAIRYFNLTMTDTNFTASTSSSSSSRSITMCSSDLFFVGDPCRHTLPPLLDYMPYFFRNKDADFVWRPFHCRLVPFVPVPVSLRLSDYCDIIDRNASVFLSTRTDISNSACNHADDITNAAASLAAICLRSSGIGFIAGFGDSLGNEVNDNLMNLLLQSDHWAPGSGVRCSNSGKRKLHRLKVEEVGSNTSLVSCIEATAIALQQSLAENVNRSLVDGFTFREVVLVTNFMSQHSVWLLTLKDIREHLQLQREQHARLGQRLALLGLRYRRILYSAVAVHGFRAGGLTPARQRWFNDQARSILTVDGQWEVLDAYNMTVGQPGGSVDGVHYRGGVSIAIADALMNMLCNGRCNRTVVID